MLALRLDLLPPPTLPLTLYLDLQLDLLHLNLLDPGICIGICTWDQNWIGKVIVGLLEQEEKPFWERDLSL